MKFGMKLYDGKEGHTHYGLGKMRCGDKGPYYIHPDGLPLLIARPDDFIQHLKSGWHWIVNDSAYNPHNQYTTIKDENYRISAGVAKISERNGIPFMWPNFETVP